MKGGAIYSSSQATVLLEESYIMMFKGNILAIFANNIAERDGTFYYLLCSVTFEGNISVNFTRNMAENGGAISVVKQW